MHPVLKRQLLRHLGDDGAGPPPPLDAARWSAFLNAVAQSYAAMERDCNLQQQALAESSRELTSRNDQLSQELRQRCEAQGALQREREEQAQLITHLEDARRQLLYSEKMASIGQLAAGVAHEINNPMGFITSNLGSLDKYVSRLSDYISVVDQAMQQCTVADLVAPVLEARKQLKIDRILADAHQLIGESQDGAGRVRRIVQDLKSFSRVDQAETALVDLNEILETTRGFA